MICVLTVLTANRRLAIDAAEADIDEPGMATQLKGLKLAFTDLKVYILAVAYVSHLSQRPLKFWT